MGRNLLGKQKDWTAAAIQSRRLWTFEALLVVGSAPSTAPA